MVFTLHRYIFREVLKVFVLAAVALTLMMSLGSILRPVQEYGVGPRQVVHLMVYFLPITLTFVLPMAALFAAALVYGRFASDNELDACRASGISFLTLVYPGLALAIMVAVANLMLSFYVMPAFVLRAEESLKNDAKQILFRNVQRQGYYMLPPDGEYRISADNADLGSNILTGVVAVQTRDGSIKRIITAESAQVSFNPHERFNEVRITAYNTHQMGPGEETVFSAELLSISADFGSLLGDDIKFKKIGEMKKIRVDPMRFYPVAKVARQVYARFTVELLVADVKARFSGEQEEFYRLHSASRVVEFRAGSCVVRDERQVGLFDGVEVAEYDVETGRELRRLKCPRAFLDIEGDELAPTLTLDVRSASWRRNDGVEEFLSRYVIRGLVLPRAVTEHFRTGDVLSDIRPDAVRAAFGGSASKKLEKLQEELAREMRYTFAEIEAEVHSRLVFGIGCVTLIMTGIALGVILKGGHLLTAFAASVVPAMILIICIMMGKNITKNPGAEALSGIVLMWGGLGVLTLFGAGLYRRLLRH